MKKKSNILLLSLGISLIVALGVYASHIKNNIEPKSKFSNRLIEIVEGETLLEELTLEYRHLHVSFPSVSIDGRYADHIKLSGFKAARNMALIDVCNDTLYIDYSNDFTPKFVGSDAEIALKIHVGGQHIESITVAGDGNIVTPIKPLGMSKDGTMVYSESDLDRYTFVFDSVSIVDGPVDMILEGSYLKVKMNKTSNTNILLRGTVDQMDIDYTGLEQLRVNGTELECKYAVINGDKNTAGITQGIIDIRVTDSLEANLYGLLDVNYYGSPKVKKYERSIGRVVHQNEQDVEL